jgi:ferredoxin
MEREIKKRVSAFYFSATGTTKKITEKLAMEISAMSGSDSCEIIDFTLPEARKKQYPFSDRDIVVVGVPVIAGRVPNILLKFLNTVKGNGAAAVATVMYGNRNYDDALKELWDILEEDGFRVLSGCAFIGEHSFSDTLAKNRPDEEDLKTAVDFAAKMIEKINTSEIHVAKSRAKEKVYRDYYKPRDKEGNPVDFRKITPKTGSACTDCKICAEVCPMGSIDHEDVTILNGICIKCCACIKKCPVQAKYFDDENFIKHKRELEEEYETRKLPELFLIM